MPSVTRPLLTLNLSFVPLNQPPIHFQLVPPFNHRANKAKRSIRIRKNHILSVLSSSHITYPPNRWSDLLPVTKLTLNHLPPFHFRPVLLRLARSTRVSRGFRDLPHPPPWTARGGPRLAHQAQVVGPSQRPGVLHLPSSPSLSLPPCLCPKTGATRISDTLDYFPDHLFPFEDTASEPVLPEPTSSRPKRAFDGTDLVGKTFLDPDLGLCTVVVPAQPFFLAPDREPPV
jgi:hypothetical protein